MQEPNPPEFHAEEPPLAPAKPRKPRPGHRSVVVQKDAAGLPHANPGHLHSHAGDEAFGPCGD